MLVELAQLLNIMAITTIFAIIWLLFYWQHLAVPYLQKGIAVIILLFIVLFVLFGKTYAAFKIDNPRASEIVFSQFLAELFTNLIMYFITFLLMKRFPELAPVLITLAVQLCASCLWAIASRRIYFNKVDPLNTIVIWDTRSDLNELMNTRGFATKFSVAKIYNVSECTVNFQDNLVGAECVFLCGVHSHERNQIAKYCIEKGIQLYLIPRVGDVIMSGAKTSNMLHIPLLCLERYAPSFAYLIIKRLFDVFASGIALIILSPLMLAISLIIKRDGGSVFYRQKRLTKDGRE